MIAIFLVNRPSGDEAQRLDKSLLIWPFLTFLLSGIIEIILFIGEAHGTVGEDGMMFTASSFGQAACLGLLYAMYLVITGKAQGPRLKEVIGGIVLGLPNYLSIYLLVYLLSKGWDGSLLFPLNSIGILLLTALVGFIIYKEAITRSNLAGIVLGIGAIILLSLNIATT